MTPEQFYTTVDAFLRYRRIAQRVAQVQLRDDGGITIWTVPHEDGDRTERIMLPAENDKFLKELFPDPPSRG